MMVSRTVLLFAATFALCGGQAWAFGFAQVAHQAERLAAQPYRKDTSTLPQDLRAMSYDDYRNIRFRLDKSLWHGTHLPFELSFLHEGMGFDQPVKINEVSSAGIRPIRFDPRDFDYGRLRLDPQTLRHLGFAGFQIRYPINRPGQRDEVLVFLGASFFRALGAGQVYGAEARGLSVDTALLSGEEFPRFTEFWVDRPARDARSLTFYALLDSPSVTGAYQFVLHPGVNTRIDVTARLYPRKKIAQLGLAPISSMFFFGENQHAAGDDYRPEVHDSDGLSIASRDGEWLWRPLVNPKRLLATSFAQVDPVGFGLMQRDRNFSSYEDLGARFDLRPSVWIEPVGNWGAGRVELVELPDPDETNHNITAFWVPDAVPAPGKGYPFAYRIWWQKDSSHHPPLAWVTQSRSGNGYMPNPDHSQAWVVDFDGPVLQELTADSAITGAVSTGGNAKLLATWVQHNDVTGGWRLTVRLKRVDDSKPVELRAFLRLGKQQVTETWSYIIPPK